MLEISVNCICVVLLYTFQIRGTALSLQATSLDVEGSAQSLSVGSAEGFTTEKYYTGGKRPLSGTDYF